MDIEDINTTSMTLRTGGEIKMPAPAIQSMARAPQPAAGMGAELFGAVVGVAEQTLDLGNRDPRPSFPAPRPGLFS